MEKLYRSNKDESVRMFENHFLERLTKVHPLTPLVLFGPVVVFFFYQGMARYQMSLLSSFLLLVLGLSTWTFVEYGLHRFIFHLKPVGPWSERLLFIFHGIHHDYPRDSRRLVMPPSASIPLALFFICIFNALLTKAYASPFLSGFFIGYLIYDLGHYTFHHFNFRNSFWSSARNRHLRHHYVDHDRGYGVSSDLWDVLLGSELKNDQELGKKFF